MRSISSGVLAVIADAWYIDTCIEEIGVRYAAHITQATDYSAFGAPLPGRTWYSSKQYRQSFNGKEKDSETELQDYGMRIYNPRLGRFLSVDPIAKNYPFLTPYQFASNCPISGTDLDGLEYFYAADGKFLGKMGNSTEVYVTTSEENQKIVENSLMLISNPPKNLGILASTFSNFCLISALDASTSLGIDNNTFKQRVGTVYAETSIIGYTVNEAAGIYDVLENRLPAYGQDATIEDVMKDPKQVVGYYAKYNNKKDRNDPINGEFTRDIIANVMDNPAQTKYTNKLHYDNNKMLKVTAGVIKGMLTDNKTKDYSNGATTWHGRDLAISTKPAYKQYVLEYGIDFKPGHNKFNLPSNSNGKYETTGVEGNTTFMKRTDKSLKKDGIDPKVKAAF